MPAPATQSSKASSAARVVVLVPHGGAPVVFRASPQQLIAQTEVILSDTLRLPTLPRALPCPDFLQAWDHMCMDLLDARHFASVDEAVAHYRTGSDRLSLHARTAVLNALERLQRRGSAALPRPERH